MKRKKLLALIYLTFLFTGTLDTFGQENSSRIEDKRVTINMSNKPLGKIFERLIVNYNIPIGFEESTLDLNHDDYEFETNLPYQFKKNYVSSDGNRRLSVKKERVFLVKQHWFTINVENEKLENVLNIIVNQMNNYEWKIIDGVVNIFPIKGRNSKYQKLLEVNIKSFDLKVEGYESSEGSPIFLIRNKIFEIPEILEYLKKNNIHYNGDLRESIDNLDRKLKVDINFSNLTFRELLNKITKIKGGGWILKRNDLFGTDKKEYVEIDI